ncbi:MAG TPA: metalloregulator ArsR/SmtB family transcription factor [Dongiaceae bacterium]|jgi:DNA-binding transcriptional ArsR family regulator|nr:metalloregulator ArsR/SmtB family transcription factor [Dongiaceae bacterium]
MDRLSAIFSALSDPTRRAILARLSDGPASATRLAKPFPISQPAISRHIKVLRSAGLIAQTREGQWRRCVLKPETMAEAADWLDQYRKFWDQSLTRLDTYLTKIQTPKKGKIS